LLVLAYVTGQPIGDKPTIAWPVWQVCLAWAALALTQAAASSCAGALTARFAPQTFLLAGWIAGAAVFAGFAVAQGPWLIVVGVGYGPPGRLHRRRREDLAGVDRAEGRTRAVVRRSGADQRRQRTGGHLGLRRRAQISRPADLLPVAGLLALAALVLGSLVAGVPRTGEAFSLPVLRQDATAPRRQVGMDAMGSGARGMCC